MYSLVFRLVLFFSIWLFTSYAEASEKLILILDWFENPNHAPIFVALEKGFFQKKGLEVIVITPADPSDPPKWVAMGKADLALDYQPHMILEVQKGLPIQQVGTLIDKPLNCLAVLARSNIKELQNLKGQTIAYSTPGIDEAMLSAMLQHRGLSLKDVRLINVHYDLSQGLLTKKVTAAMGMMRNIEPVQLKLLGQPVRTFLPEEYGVPSYSELVFISKQGFNKEKLAPFFAALNESRQYLQRHPEESWQLFIKAHQQANTPWNKASWWITLNLFADDFTRVDQVQYDNMASFLRAGVAQTNQIPKRAKIQFRI